jgi:hypothetical protein
VIRLGFGVRQLAAALSARGLLQNNASHSDSPEQAPAAESGGKPPHSKALRLAANGELMMKINGGEARFHKPVVCQRLTTDRGRRTNSANRRSPICTDRIA